MLLGAKWAQTLWLEPCTQPVARKGRGLAVGMGRQGEGQGRTILPQLRDKLVRGLVQQCGDVVVQRVHVLHQPLIGFVIHL